MASARKIRTVEDLETLPVVRKPRTLSRAPSIDWSRKVPKRSAKKRRDVVRAIVIQISTATVLKATMRTAQQTWWSASRLSPALRYQLEPKTGTVVETRFKSTSTQNINLNSVKSISKTPNWYAK